MIIYVNSNNEIKDVNTTLDESLTPLEITDYNPFEGWSVAKICCYKATVSEGRVTMMTPYVDSRLIEHIDQLSRQTEAIVTDNKLYSVLKQAKLVAVNNTDEQALEVKDLYDTWEEKPEGYTFTVNERILFNENDQLYKVLTEHSKQLSWKPDVSPSLFVRIAKEEIPEWLQPQGSTDAYMNGDKVKHNGFIWESLIDNNVWEPTDEASTLWTKIGPIE